MRVFVTGSTGFIGSGVVTELISSGHRVLGLTRSDKGAKQLQEQGAEVLHGTLDNLDVLRKGASECDAIAHLAFVHDFSDFAGSCATDQAAIKAMGEVLAAKEGKKSALVVTSGMAQPAGGDEDDGPDMENPMSAMRGPAEQVCLDFAKHGVRATVVRLPPTVHGPGSSGFAGILAQIALQKGNSAYVEGSNNRWCAVHRDDAAKLYRYALEKAEGGSVFQAIAEDGVAVKDIATAIGKEAGLEVIGIPQEKVEEQFGWFAFGLGFDKVASSEKTRERTGWKPTEAGVIEDMPVIVKYAKAGAA